MSDSLRIAQARAGQNGLELLHAGPYRWSTEERRRALREWVADMGCAGAACRVVLGYGDYRIIQIQRPDVPLAEMRDALRWRVQEFLDFPAEEAELEFFPMPSPKQLGQAETVTALACHQALPKAYADLCQSAGLRLEVIDVPELALRNLGQRLPESGKGMAMLYLEEHSGLMQIQKDAVIYLSRRLDFGAAALAAELAEAEPPGDAVLARVAREIQRSCGYYESMFRVPHVASLIVAPIAENTRVLVDRLNAELGMISRTMDVGALVPCAERLEDAIQQRCIPAIGAAVGRYGTPP